MRLPRGDLVRSRVVAEPAVALAAALDRRLTGYAVWEPQATLLLDGDARGVLTFEDGVPVLAYAAAADRGGPDALAELATPGPLNVELYELPAAALAAAHENTDLRVPPGMPAEEVANASALAQRTRERAPADRERRAAARPGRRDADADADVDAETATATAGTETETETETETSGSAVEAFLADEERVAAIRERARAEAERRAAEWGLADALEDGDDADDVSDGAARGPDFEAGTAAEDGIEVVSDGENP